MNAILRASGGLPCIWYPGIRTLLFCSGYLMAFPPGGTTGLTDLLKVVLIGFLGSGAELVLANYLARERGINTGENENQSGDQKPAGTRSLAGGHIPSWHAPVLFCTCAGIATALILTLPYPHSVYVLLIMVYCWVIGVFSHAEKRIPQVFPFPQVIGRTGFALVPVAGYVCAGLPDIAALFMFLFFYPFAIAHDAVNDLAGEEDDRARGLFTLPTIYDAVRTRIWIAGFTVIHIMMAFLFITRLPIIGKTGVYAGLALLIIANIVILWRRTPEAALNVLPLFQLAMVLYAGGVCAGVLLAI